MLQRLRTAIRNPITILLPLIVAAFLGWTLYMHSLNAPNHAQHNLLTSNHNGSLPKDWKIRGSLPYDLTKGAGYEGGQALGVRVKSADKGSIDIQTSVAPIHAGKVYLYKSYHKSEMPFALLAKYFYEDGTSRLELVKQYGSSDKWTTDSFAFRADDRATGIQVQYRLANTGTLWLDRSYLDTRTRDVYITPDPASSKPNLLENGNLSGGSNGAPLGWNTRDLGSNEAGFAYIKKDGETYLHTEATKFKDGEVAWQSAPQDSSAGQYVQVTVEYRSNTTVHVMANYNIADGTTNSIPIAELPPANEWTTAHAYVEAPLQATKLSIATALWTSGFVDTDSYQLKDITKDGARHFRRPLVSIVFNNGWSSTYSTAGQIMGFLGYKGTFYVNSSSINQPGFMRDEQVKRLLKDEHQLASSSYEYVDLTTLNARQLSRQMRLASGYLKDNTNQNQGDFMPPYGRSDPEVEAAIRKYFHSSVSGGEGINTKQTFDSYNLKAVHVDRDTSMQRFAKAIDSAKAENGWLILSYDRIQDNSSSTAAVTSKAFTEQVDMILKSKMPVVTISQGLEEEWGE